jgi:hypothetical protein
MLIVLAALVVAVTACATLARIAAVAAAAKRFQARRLSAEDLVRAADGPIVRWLTVDSSGIVLPPDSACPEVPVLFDMWAGGDDPVEIGITGYDQCGMLPLSLAGSPLRMAIPAKVARLAEELKTATRRGSPVGLDQFAGAASRLGVPLFPTPPEANRSIFGRPGSGPSAAPHRVSPAPALGALIATHNPGRLLNVNTAPMPLVEAALRAQGRGGIDQILKARSEGRAASVPPPPPGATMDVLAPVPSAASHVWAFRVDARVGPVGRSVWAVYTADSGEWRCVQRLVIDR